MTVHLLSEHSEFREDEAVADAMEQLRQMAEPAPPRVRVVTRRALPDREVLTAMSGLASLLSVRLMLMLAVIGAFALAWQAVNDPTTLRIWVLGVYSVVTIAPLAVLSRRA